VGFRRLAQNQHWFVTGLLIAAVIPAFSMAKLPLHIDWQSFLGIYWIGTAIHSIFGAVLLYAASFPLGETLTPVWRRYWREKPRLVFAALFAVLMACLFGWMGGFLLVVDILAILELLDRSRSSPGRFTEAIRRVFLPAAYLFIGLVTVYAYLHLIVRMEFICADDPSFNKLDALIFHGATVCGTAHAAARYLSSAVYPLLEWWYYSLYTLLGGGLIITALCFTENRAFRYVGTLLTAYYLAVGLFYLFPSMGPFSFCKPPGMEMVPHTRSIQLGMLAKARALWAHSNSPGINIIGPGDYFIDFPCMHLALPAITLWYLRESRRLVLYLIPYVLGLAVAIVIFEWHYFVGMVAGVVVAALAIAVVDFPTRRVKNSLRSS
jgi:PAP2 superfamily